MEGKTFKAQIAKVRINRYEPESYMIDAYYYNYRILIEPVSDRSGKVSAAVYKPGGHIAEVPAWTTVVTKRVFNRALVEAVDFITKKYNRL